MDNYNGLEALAKLIGCPTQSSFAQLIGVRQPRLTRYWHAGSRNPPRGILDKLAVLNVDVAAVLYADGKLPERQPPVKEKLYTLIQTRGGWVSMPQIAFLLGLKNKQPSTAHFARLNELVSEGRLITHISETGFHARMYKAVEE